MNLELKKIILEYINEVNKVCLLMLKGLNLKTREDLFNYRIRNPIGEFELDGVNKYKFHGRGCKFSNKSICIDWDFGYHDKWCGLNPWLIADYIKDNYKENKKFQNGDIIKKEFESAILQGEIEIKYELYYLI